MTEPHTSEVTQLLLAANRGEHDAVDRLLPLVYDEMRALAGSYLGGERPDHTLQPTALVHEVYLKLVDQDRVQWKNRGHFFAVAATAMRRILVNHARDRSRIKRGGDRTRVDDADPVAVEPGDRIDLIALDEAMNLLAEMDARKVRVVELRFFVGLTLAEVAEVLDVAPATVKRDWEFARTWLMRKIGNDEPSDL